MGGQLDQAKRPLPTVKNVPKTIARQTKNLESFQFLEKFCMFLVDSYMFFVCSSYVVVCSWMFLLCSGTHKKVLECSKLSWGIRIKRVPKKDVIYLCQLQLLMGIV